MSREIEVTYTQRFRVAPHTAEAQRTLVFSSKEAPQPLKLPGWSGISVPRLGSPDPHGMDLTAALGPLRGSARPPGTCMLEEEGNLFQAL